MSEDDSVGLPNPHESEDKDIADTTHRVIEGGKSTFQDFDEKINSAAERGMFGSIKNDPFSRELAKRMGDDAHSAFYALATDSDLANKLKGKSVDEVVGYLERNKAKVLDRLMPAMTMDAFVAHDKKSSASRPDASTDNYLRHAQNEFKRSTAKD